MTTEKSYENHMAYDRNFKKTKQKLKLKLKTKVSRTNNKCFKLISMYQYL